MSLIDKEEINNAMLYGDDHDSKEIKNNKNKNGKFEINLKSQNNFSGEKGYKKMRQDVSQNGNKINNFKKIIKIYLMILMNYLKKQKKTLWIKMMKMKKKYQV